MGDSSTAAGAKRVYAPEEFLGEKPYCDLVMKGGFTSGVVYPLAVVEVARHYRVRNIGGASAGAIAAAITAAAEYAREGGGYLKLAGIAEEASRRLLSLFQPTPALRPLFDTFLATLGTRAPVYKALAALGRLCSGYKWATALGLAPALLLAAIAIVLHQPLALVGVPFLAVLGFVIALGLLLVRAVQRTLPSQGFGFCPGLQQPGYDEAALTEWLAERIDDVAGLGLNPERPLTFGDLQQRGINLEVVTTNITMGRPHRIPFDSNIFMFDPDEFARIFPERIVKWMDEHSTQVPGHAFHWLPYLENLPVVFAVRPSLNFPVLLSAVPLHAKDFTRENETERTAASAATSRSTSSTASGRSGRLLASRWARTSPDTAAIACGCRRNRSRE